jgi:hypothetical protein
VDGKSDAMACFVEAAQLNDILLRSGTSVTISGKDIAFLNVDGAEAQTRPSLRD